MKLPTSNLARVCNACPTYKLPVFLMLFATFLSGSCQSTSEPGYTLISSRPVADVWLAPEEPAYVRLAVEDLIGDVQKITGKKLQVVENIDHCQNCLIIGSLDNARAKATLETLVGQQDARTLNGRWEAYRVKNQGQQLVIAGSSPRGTMFGIYHFIEKYLGVDPTCYWSGLEPKQQSRLAWDGISITQDEPTFRFRGGFINDEDLLTEWKNGGGQRNIDYRYYGQVVHPEVIQRVFETLLRLRLNLVIPASFVDIRNPAEERLIQEAAKRGLFVSMHHVEPMGVSAFGYQNYWKEKGENPLFSFYSEPEKLKEVWRAYAEKWAKYPNVIWQIGLRGIADRPMWMADPGVPQSDAERGRIISEAMQAQYEIIKEVTHDNNPRMTTTLWAEGAGLNQGGHLQFPEGTIVVFADNSPGWKWQQDFYETERESSRKYGIYYHHQLWGSGPHLVQAVPPQKTYEMFSEAVAHQASDYAIMNISNVREFVLGLTASADMLYDMDTFQPDDFLQSWFQNRFGEAAEEVRTVYQRFFDSYQLHEKTGTPLLLDGQTRSYGLKVLDRLKMQLTEPAQYRKMLAKEQKSEQTVEQSWGSRYLSDMHPASGMDPDEVLPHLSAQIQHLESVGERIESVEKQLAGDTLQFFRTNLIAQHQMLLGLNRWLEAVILARFAMDEGNKQAAGAHLHRAKQYLQAVEEAKTMASQGDWQHWYRGDRKMNIGEMQERTDTVLQILSE